MTRHFMTIPRIIVAGTHSGCGKTTVASGLMAALVARGYTVQPFKVGPDFIDPSHHTAICGRASRNLDAFMMGEQGILDTFNAASEGGAACEGADIAVIEGVMGMYDGLEGTDTASTAHVSKILKAPVLLVVDTGGMSRSAGALVKGFREFDPAVDLAGVILNRVGGESHRRMIEPSLQVRPVGWIPFEKTVNVKSRHLGLNMAHEADTLKKAGEIVEKYCDVDAILQIAGQPRKTAAADGAGITAARKDVKIGIAMDEAFCFYYRDNFDRLTEAGADLVFFSPARDRLPDVDAVYLGGGYPELHAGKLEASRCRDDLKKAAEDGMPVYAECGGLMYLTESISTAEKEHRMAGILPAKAVMTTRLQALGYVEAKAIAGPLFARGMEYRGHEFHYSRVEHNGDARFAITMARGKGIADGLDGMYEHNAVGTYTHAYFTPEMARALVDSARKYRRR
ncbi:cobyrinate a,c-diamide synthase [Methanocella arvoryzae]|uniref:Cobyrinate a,c-diamide synthase n=1 Tax=Methanocella arvoryzae (strain DSM 22066 / NBRC 105507 / MRE50) TaxID=351160 RepID=Q0W5Z8_METAR|nr:cobyrinate a,c-diamide synthase [Methanocella arvoryzae]CAJ36195.1 cobyrinic acid a,c-diamide synthase [Methanocella arvoryzae MRE50]